MKKWKCIICSYIHKGEEPPEKCPVCGADKSMFIEVVEPSDTVEKGSEHKEGGNKEVQDIGTTNDFSGVKKWKCTICSYIHVGDEPPVSCPVCGADSSAFIEVVRQELHTEKERNIAAENGQDPGIISPLLTTIGNMGIRYHLHPMTVHIPNGVIPVAVVFILLAILFGDKAFEMAAFLNSIFVFLTLPFVIGAGVVDWQKKFKGAMTRVFIIKIICSAIVVTFLGVLICWRLIDAEIALSGGYGAWAYLAISLVALIATGIAGHLGGKLVFGK